MPGESARKQAERTVGRTEDDKSLHNRKGMNDPKNSGRDAEKTVTDTTTDTETTNTPDTKGTRHKVSEHAKPWNVFGKIKESKKGGWT